MNAGVEARYHRAITELGVRKRWYQADTDLFYAAVVAAVDGVDSADILSRADQLDSVLPPTHDLHVIKQTLAAVTAARDLDVATYIAAVEAVAEFLREAVRTKRLRRLAGAVIVAVGDGGYQVTADRAATIYHAWNDRHRVLTGAVDLVLAAITDVVGLDQFTALDRAQVVDGQLAAAGYKNEWDVVRILALDGSASAAERFVQLARANRGRRRKPVSDRRHLLAIAALADHPPTQLVEVMANRFNALKVNRFRPDHRTRWTLAALMTLGQAAPPESRLGPAFHGFVMREHFITSYAESTSG